MKTVTIVASDLLFHERIIEINTLDTSYEFKLEKLPKINPKTDYVSQYDYILSKEN